ncbi:hypothetical protein D9756_008196 [Leucocoprinus leucothites]|uniref:GST N-terminal domain-containing protein n=1 Tax=Leucocoprinus leucothites TaxID=201217 RepID=A0A8H5FW63_9AGAR|nr:hypothetical protein D9756_008196 [Leucoagaricus leucothites]
MSERITLYSAKLCPFAHRVEIALKESGLPYNRCEIDFFNKPEWYIEKVNPAGKVPAIAYGGPEVLDPTKPSPESTKLFESLVLVEFVNDLITLPSGGSTALFPQDPVLRAKARFFIESVCSKLVPAFFNVHLRGEHPSLILSAIDTLQDLLPEKEGFALGTQGGWSMADAAVLTVMARAEIGLENDLGVYDEGEGKKIWENVMNEEKYERFRRWFGDAKARKSFQETFDAEFVLENFKSRYPPLRAKRMEALKAASTA